MPFLTHLGLSSHPLCDLDTIFNPFSSFISPIFSCKYPFQPIVALQHTHFVIAIPFSTHFDLSLPILSLSYHFQPALAVPFSTHLELIAHSFRLLDSTLNEFWPFIMPILSFKYHCQLVLGFHRTYFVIRMPFSTHFGLSSHPFCHPNAILNQFRAFVVSILPFKYHFQPISGFHRTHLDIRKPFLTHFRLAPPAFRHVRECR